MYMACVLYLNSKVLVTELSRNRYGHARKRTYTKKQRTQPFQEGVRVVGGGCPSAVGGGGGEGQCPTERSFHPLPKNNPSGTTD